MPLNINFQQILLHMFNFVILAFGLYMLLYKPVVAFMKKREDHFADLEKQAQEAKSQAEATLAEYNAKLTGADEEIRQKNAAAAQEADRQRQERIVRRAGGYLQLAYCSAHRQTRTSCSRAPAVPPNRSAMPCSKARRRTLPRWLCPLRAS